MLRDSWSLSSSANVVLTSPGGFMKTFPNDVNIESSSHGEFRNCAGNSRTSVKSILSRWLREATNGVLLKECDTIGNTYTIPSFNGKRKM